MRIVIDVQCIPDNALARVPAFLTTLQALVRHSNEHQIVLAIHQQNCENIDAWRLAFYPLPANLRIEVYDANRGNSAWQEAAASQLRDHFMARFSPDWIVLPEAMADGAMAPMGEAGAAVHTLVLLSDTARTPTDDDATAQNGLRRRVMHQAALWASSNDAVRAAWAATVGNKPEVTIDCAAVDQAAAQLWQAMQAVPARRILAIPETPSTRLRLAFISPLPPEKSGVANYSAELVQQLNRFYDIDLIVDHAGPIDSDLSANFRVRGTAWFETHCDDYDRVMYQFGNSNMHQHMFGLIRRHPGIVVLHDFFLSNILHEIETSGAVPHAFLQALYESHGYTGLLVNRLQGRVPTVWGFPCNKAVLEHASGVIVHSQYSRQLASHWYGDETASNWQTLPLMRGRNVRDADTRSRAELRAALGIGADDFVIASFGLLGATKLNDRLLDAFLASPLSDNQHCRLIFVGENSPTAAGEELVSRIADSSAHERISITGFVSGADYAAYLRVGDMAVQLRAQSRGESSAAVLDCLLYGLPTIVNAHGASAALPDDVLIKLDDDFTTAALSDALLQLHDDAGLRHVLSEHSIAYITREHSPAQVGLQFYQAIERVTLDGGASRERRLLRSLKRIAVAQAPSAIALAQTAAAIAANRAPTTPRQLMVDVSALVETDLRTGIQRVVRSILLALVQTPPPGFRVEPVYSIARTGCYRYARRFTANMIGEHELELIDDPVEVRSGDIFLGLDLHAHVTTSNSTLLAAMRRSGMQVYFVIFDILPLLRPAAFPFATDESFGQYIDTVATLSDGLICISRAVADDLKIWLMRHPMPRISPLPIGYFHLGADIDASAPTRGLPANIAHIMQALTSRPTFLMVGTVEPRKGHAQALAALELLWESGVDVNLVVVGKRGWMVDAVAKAMEQHVESGRRLFWLQGVSDEMLLKLYESSSALLAASVGEGFGLPLIEAAQHRLPIIARRLPVFEEVSGKHAYYFEGERPGHLMKALSAWLILFGEKRAPGSEAMPWLTWSASAAQLLKVAIGGNWYASVGPVAAPLPTTAA